jgi:very-short-patch-repair endonuclease
LPISTTNWKYQARLILLERGRGEGAEGQSMTTEPKRFARQLRQHATKAEYVLWQALRGRKFQNLKFKRQVPFNSYTVDFLCFERKITIEIDGKQHDWYKDYDDKRTSEIEAQGFSVLRFTNDDVLLDLEKVLCKIGEACGFAASVAPSPLPLSHPGEGMDYNYDRAST